MKISERLKKLPPYLFVGIERLKRQAKEAGRDVIDFGVGDPDQPPPTFVIEALRAALNEPDIHKYALDLGQPEFREAIATWYMERFNVRLDPDTEVLPLIGSKEGIAHAPLAFINPGDVALVPDPCYPPYVGGTIFAGGEPYPMALREENEFLPDLKIPLSICRKARLMYINYPNNPTAAVTEVGFFNTVAKFALKNDIIICHDAAYSEITFNGYSQPSFLQAEGAKEVGIEFHSLSKTFNMTGWRVGFACGNKDIISALAKVKSNIDSGIFNAIQKAGTVALRTKGDHLEKMKRLYQERRDTLVEGLNSIGWKVEKPKATFYVWCRVPKGNNSVDFSQKLLKEADIVITPGNGFGKFGEGFVRFAITVPKERIKEAVERMRRVL
ncbi:MAG: LL-diaminopimelate aminotransferase [Candidatus Omnitrophica bacterium]|nr:LL-diaminopimelate aminotransferase [Candidatus Omnitrophota bacterium]